MATQLGFAFSVFAAAEDTEGGSGRDNSGALVRAVAEAKTVAEATNLCDAAAKVLGTV